MKTLKEVVLILGSGGFGIEELKTMIIDYNMTDLNYGAAVASDVERRKIKNYGIEDKLKGIVQLNIDGTGKKTKYGYKNARKEMDKLKEICADYPIILHLVGFGGGTGTGTALAIAQELPNRRHMFIGPMSGLDEGRQILRNMLTNLDMMYDYGRFWPFDNRYRKSMLTYNDINRRIAQEIGFVLTLPDIRSYVMRDMDTGNVLDIWFPEQYYKKGLFSIKRFFIDDLEEDISFENIQDRDDSVSSKFDLSIYEKVGIVIKLPKDQELNTAVEENIEKLREWILAKIPEASIHEAVYKGKQNKAEIFMMFSGPVFSGELLSEYTEKVKQMDENFNKKYANKSFSFGLDLDNDIEFNNAGTDNKKDLFDSSPEETDDKKKDLFDNQNEDLLDFLN